jgi:hypothetical protein
MNFESRRPTVGALAHDPRHRATIGNNEIGHITEADKAAIYEAPNSGDREQSAPGSDVDDHDACAPRIDPMRTVGVGDDRPGKHDVADRVWAVPARLD